MAEGCRNFPERYDTDCASYLVKMRLLFGDVEVEFH